MNCSSSNAVHFRLPNPTGVMSILRFIPEANDVGVTWASNNTSQSDMPLSLILVFIAHSSVYHINLPGCTRMVDIAVIRWLFKRQWQFIARKICGREYIRGVVRSWTKKARTSNFEIIYQLCILRFAVRLDKPTVFPLPYYYTTHFIAM